ncbi:MAG: hypothetical protein AUH13_28655 [Acidobacteria bacterium 13_2_20CM_58_27]|nr:MAG: hypothetical protein AUH13_28655 [Acidobacteria bacterium 13_2_20CM_58_27]
MLIKLEHSFNRAVNQQILPASEVALYMQARPQPRRRPVRYGIYWTRRIRALPVNLGISRFPGHGLRLIRFLRIPDKSVHGFTSAFFETHTNYMRLYSHADAKR